MGELWNKEAADLKPAGAPGVMEGGKPRVTLHVTVSKPGSFDAMHGVLVRAKAEPHFLYDPATDRLGQYFPCNVSARALRNDGTRRTNGHGSVNIQIEVCAMPDGFTKTWKPGPNWLALLRTVRSWGVPDVWPAGRLARSGSDNVDRTWASYSKAGWFGHCNVPGNDHWDPGPIDQQAIFARTTAVEEPDMQLTDKITVSTFDAAGKANGSQEISYQTLLNRLNFVYHEILRQRATDAARASDMKALAVAVKEQGVDVPVDQLAAALAQAITTLAAKES